MTVRRETKYCQPLRDALRRRGHATNAELLQDLQQLYPELSATTVHRLTARLVEDGEVATAPADRNGARRFDATTEPHDHFVCTGCNGLRDLDVAAQIMPLLADAVPDCTIGGRFIINGQCQHCV